MDNVKKITILLTGLIVILILIGGIVFTFSMAGIKIPAAPILTSSNNASEQDAKNKEIGNYKDLVSSLEVQRTNIYDYVIIKTLLPLLGYIITAVLTYIFTKAALKAFKTYTAEKYRPQ